MICRPGFEVKVQGLAAKGAAITARISTTLMRYSASSKVAATIARPRCTTGIPT